MQISQNRADISLLLNPRGLIGKHLHDKYPSVVTHHLSYFCHIKHLIGFNLHHSVTKPLERQIKIVSTLGCLNLRMNATCLSANSLSFVKLSSLADLAGKQPQSIAVTAHTCMHACLFHLWDCGSISATCNDHWCHSKAGVIHWRHKIVQMQCRELRKMVGRRYNSYIISYF